MARSERERNGRLDWKDKKKCDICKKWKRGSNYRYKGGNKCTKCYTKLMSTQNSYNTSTSSTSTYMRRFREAIDFAFNPEKCLTGDFVHKWFNHKTHPCSVSCFVNTILKQCIDKNVIPLDYQKTWVLGFRTQHAALRDRFSYNNLLVIKKK